MFRPAHYLLILSFILSISVAVWSVRQCWIHNCELSQYMEEECESYLEAQGHNAPFLMLLPGN